MRILAYTMFVLGFSYGQAHAERQSVIKDLQSSAHDATAYKGFWNRAEEDPVAAFTGILAVFTIVLAVVSIVQIRFLIRADNSARLAAEAAVDQAKETHREYVRNHRPKLRVRYFTLGPHDITLGCPVAGGFEVVNVGGVAAHIVKSHCQVFLGVDLPLVRPYQNAIPNNSIVENVAIEAGSSEIVLFNSGYSLPLNTFNQSILVYVMGWIDYADDNGTKRRTAFCREHRTRAQGRRFYITENTDYDYKTDIWI